MSARNLRGPIIAAFVVVAVVIVIVAQVRTGNEKHSAGPDTSPQVPVTVRPTPTVTSRAPSPSPTKTSQGGVVGLAQAKRTASEYLTAIHRVDYRHLEPNYPIQKVKPYVTTAYFKRMTARIPSGPLSAGDRVYVRQTAEQRLSTFASVRNISISVGDELPDPLTALPLRITYVTDTTSVADPEGTTTDPIPVTVTMALVHGVWLVNSENGA